MSSPTVRSPMGAQCFDTIARRFATPGGYPRISRRRALIQGGAGLAAGALAVAGLPALANARTTTARQAAHEDWWETFDRTVKPGQRDAINANAEPAGFPGLERIDTDASADEMREAAARSPLRPVPLVVLTHGRPWDWPPGFPVDAIETAWRPLQDDLVALVPAARLVVAEQSPHFIQIDEPELVIDAIRQVVESVRDPSTWAVSTPVASSGDVAIWTQIGDRAHVRKNGVR